MKKHKTKYSDSSTSVTVNEDTVDNLPKIWIRIPYLGSRGHFLVKSCVNRVQRFLSKPVKNLSLLMTLKNFHILFPTKINFLLYLAVMLYMRSLAQVVAKHISARMTQKCLSVRLKEHATRLSSSAVGEHFSVCEHAQ